MVKLSPEEKKKIKMDLISHSGPTRSRERGEAPLVSFLPPIPVTAPSAIDAGHLLAELQGPSSSSPLVPQPLSHPFATFSLSTLHFIYLSFSYLGTPTANHERRQGKVFLLHAPAEDNQGMPK